MLPVTNAMQNKDAEKQLLLLKIRLWEDMIHIVVVKDAQN